MKLVDEMEIIELIYEYDLTIAFRQNCNCAKYLIERKKVLFPEVLKRAEQYGENPAELFHRFSNRIHENLCEKGTETK